ncbi:MAG: MarR family transcriptional regulator [Halioglobus sp.]
MNQIIAKPAESESIRKRYRDNSCRHLLGTAHYLQTRVMNTLKTQCGHKHLRLGFTPYISLIGERGRRLTDIAEVLGISRQACNQAVKPIESAGYIARKADQTDGRAKTLYLTPAGVKLRSDGTRIVTELDREFAAIVGNDAIADTSKTLGKIYHHLALGPAQERVPRPPEVGMGALLPALADYILHRLMELTRDKGHRRLQLRFGQVLTLIGPSGGRIQQIATIHDVSKQAISVIATELEEQGYLQRNPDPTDARQIVLNFTPRGNQLIADSVLSVEELEHEFAAIVGQAALKRMNITLRQLYLGLQLEPDVFEKHNSSDIGHLAHQLQQELGPQGSRALARLLLTPSVNTR